jgi:hypothetical protein
MVCNGLFVPRGTPLTGDGVGGCGSLGSELPDRTADPEDAAAMQIMNKLTYANVASTLALIIAVGGGGAAVAAVAKNSVGSPQIKDGAVQTADLGANAVVSSKVQTDTLTGADIKESTLGKVPTAAKADQATTADSATAAGSATTADSATNADHATSADSATTAGSATTADTATLATRADNVRAAYVQSDGTLTAAQSVGATEASKLGTGTYQVIFDRNVSACVFVGSAGDPGIGSASVAVVSATRRSGNVNGVFVITRDMSNAVVDKNFALAVIC